MRHTIIAIAAAALAFIHNAHANVYPTVEAEDGTRVTIESIQPITPPGRNKPYEIVSLTNEKMQQMYLEFDCNNHYTGGGSPWLYIQPHSVAAKIAQIACARTHS